MLVLIFALLLVSVLIPWSWTKAMWNWIFKKLWGRSTLKHTAETVRENWKERAKKKKEEQRKKAEEEKAGSV